MAKTTKDAQTGSAEQEMLSRSTSGVSFLVFSQLFTKLATFLLNQLLIRYISPAVFGTASYLEFVTSAILFFSREGERLAVQRTKLPKEDKKDDTRYSHHSARGAVQSIVNFGYVPFVVGIPVSALVFYSQFKNDNFQAAVVQAPHGHICIALCLLLVFLELAMEPFYAVSQFELQLKKRSIYESIAVFSRCIVTFLVVIASKRLVSSLGERASEGLAVLAFTLGQLAYSGSLFVLYSAGFVINNARKAPAQQNSLLVHKVYVDNADYYYLNREVFSFWKNIYVQMVFKHFLTEGDRLLINYLCTVSEQGVYSVVSNYGSMIARLVFQPIEESLRLFFTRLLSEKSKENITKSFTVLLYLCLFYLNLTVIIGLGGYANGAYLLRLLIGGKLSKWALSNVFEIFPQYILYIPFLAFNGILEGVFSSISDEHDVRRFSGFMTFLTVVVLAFLYLFITHLELGLSGLIYANGINMSLRIAYCSQQIVQFYRKNGIAVSLSHIARRSVFLLFLGLILQVAQFYLLGGNMVAKSLTDVVKSAAICIIYLAVMLYHERAIIREPAMAAFHKLTKKTKTD